MSIVDEDGHQTVALLRKESEWGSTGKVEVRKGDLMDVELLKAIAQIV